MVAEVNYTNIIATLISSGTGITIAIIGKRNAPTEKEKYKEKNFFRKLFSFAIAGGIIGLIGVYVFRNFCDFNKDKFLNATVYTRPIVNTPSLILTDYTTNIQEDKEESEWTYLDSDSALFTYRFINTSTTRLSCVIEFKSGYCKGESNCRTETGDRNWIERDRKLESLVLEPLSSCKLSGQMAQFPEEVSPNCILSWKIISVQKIN
jgi:hypothetical protein